ncbi:uncharacterized protein LOC108913810 [Anoplophora glabripennis]|uniref:uncharacterized protein LOC108913810 n=1 Tax=Anoplophora glabripennis TaxID=217634 RepID=UPI000875154C|nr:uncharacterized protein LOC108913810 [Anoplophora glabripennis]
MKAALIILLVSIVVIANGNPLEQTEDLAEGEETLFRHPRAICYPLTCNSQCFPRGGYCSYNSCHCR